MKKIIVATMLLVLTFPIMTCAQGGPNEIISKDNVSIDNIKTIFENAFYEIQERH